MAISGKGAHFPQALRRRGGRCCRLALAPAPRRRTPLARGLHGAPATLHRWVSQDARRPRPGWSSGRLEEPENESAGRGAVACSGRRPTRPGGGLAAPGAPGPSGGGTVAHAGAPPARALETLPRVGRAAKAAARTQSPGAPSGAVSGHTATRAWRRRSAQANGSRGRGGHSMRCSPSPIGRHRMHAHAQDTTAEGGGRRREPHGGRTVRLLAA